MSGERKSRDELIAALDAMPQEEHARRIEQARRKRQARARERNRKSAKAAGAFFNRQIADYLAEHVDDRIEVRHSNGNKDRGDIAGLRHMGQRVVIECKNEARTNLGTWATETEIERGNDDAIAGLIAHKRHGKGAAGDQWVTCTLADLVALLTGTRPDTNPTDDSTTGKATA